MATSHDTLLRLIQRSEPPVRATPRVLSVDDFAWKKGRRYGTILIDLEAHTVVDVLPDREAATFAKWLLDHPGVEVISRDRAGNYADGARQGAPSAQQICDRFHLLLNLQEALKRLFERKHACLKQVAMAEQAQEEQASQAKVARGEGSPTLDQSITVGPSVSPAHQAQRQLRREKRKQRYDEVMKLHEQGVSQVAIATLLGLHRDTVRRYIRAPQFPEIVRPKRHKSKLDPYKEYLHEQWATGQYTVSSLLSKLRERGYQGGETQIYDYLIPKCLLCGKIKGKSTWKEMKVRYESSHHTSSLTSLS